MCGAGGIHARLLRDALGREGIPSRLQAGGEDQFVVTPVLFAGSDAELFQIWVNQRDLARAQAVRAAYEGKTK